jgi:hypothetical protein
VYNGGGEEPMSTLSLVVVLLGAAVQAPVAEVTVFSDRARVTRSAELAVEGTQVVRLPPLLDSIDPSTVRVEAQGAEVVRVDLSPLDEDAFPTLEARQLLEALERKDDELARLRGELSSYQGQLQSLERVRPVTPKEEPLKANPKLDGAGWTQAMGYLQEAISRVQGKARELSASIEERELERQRLAERAALIGGGRRRAGYQVLATVRGQGRAKLRLTYVAAPARWVPTYDVQLSPEGKSVQVSFAGLVSQETGEDWGEASLTLSTAVPAQRTRMPELTRWTIGEKERFIPTPYKRPPSIRPPPPAPPLPQSTDEDEALRRRLLARAHGATAAGEARPLPPSPPRGGARAGALVSRDDSDDYAKELPPEPSYAAPPPQRQMSARSQDAKKTAPSAAPSMAMEFSGSAVEEEARDRAAPAAAGVSLAPPATWRPPSYPPNSPAALAGGYDLAWSSLQKESVGSGKGARRVALFSQSWPVKVERKLFPALADDAFLVAELKSPAATPLPGGTARLYVGADPAGEAKLDLVSPGQPFTLPLGLDRALRPVRNVQLLTQETGLIGKDDVSRYQVTVELANPYPFPVFVRILDQWPVGGDEHVEVKLLETQPWAIQDPAVGSLEWHLTLPPSKKSQVSFTYSLKRPRSWRLQQR